MAVALGLALVIQAFLVKPYRIPSESMVPTLTIGQRVIVNRVGTHLGDPDIGDVVVFNPPAGADSNECGADHDFNQACPKPTDKKSRQTFIKRVVAGPGDRLKIVQGHPIVNGKRIPDSFSRACGGGDSCNLDKEFRIPAGHFFMMGDNRGASDDSRFWGPVPDDNIIGRAFLTYWPPKRVGTL